MRSSDTRMIKIANYNTELNPIINMDFDAFAIYHSKGLLAHLHKRKHFVAAKYINNLQDIILHPDYAGYYNGTIELIKCYADNIFISIKLDAKRNQYYIATMFEVRRSKIDSYVRSGRLNKVP